MSSKKDETKVKNSWRGITGFITGLVALVAFAGGPLCVILAIVSHVFSGLGVARGEPLAKAGLVLGILAWVVMFGWLLLVVPAILASIPSSF